MIKLFISQPMKDKTDEEVKEVRERAVRVVKDFMKDEKVEVIDNMFERTPKDVPPAWYLGMSIQLLSGADVAYFCDGWSLYRGCQIEHLVCKKYNIPTLSFEDLIRERCIDD